MVGAKRFSTGRCYRTVLKDSFSTGRFDRYLNASTFNTDQPILGARPVLMGVFGPVLVSNFLAVGEENAMGMHMHAWLFNLLDS